jgi:hypothetical protein
MTHHRHQYVQAYALCAPANVASSAGSVAEFGDGWSADRHDTCTQSGAGAAALAFVITD